MSVRPERDTEANRLLAMAAAAYQSAALQMQAANILLRGALAMPEGEARGCCDNPDLTDPVRTPGGAMRICHSCGANLLE
jgi:hypothetical protein